MQFVQFAFNRLVELKRQKGSLSRLTLVGNRGGWFNLEGVRTPHHMDFVDVLTWQRVVLVEIVGDVGRWVLVLLVPVDLVFAFGFQFQFQFGFNCLWHFVLLMSQLCWSWCLIWI